MRKGADESNGYCFSCCSMMLVDLKKLEDSDQPNGGTLAVFGMELDGPNFKGSANSIATLTKNALTCYGGARFAN